MDQDRDGTVSMDDLKEVYASLGNVKETFREKRQRAFLWYALIGKAPKDAELKSMLEEAQGPVNFTMLLTLFGDRLNGTDEENVILNAWKNFDPEGTGLINQKKSVFLLQTNQSISFSFFSSLVSVKFSPEKDVPMTVSRYTSFLALLNERIFFFSFS